MSVHYGALKAVDGLSFCLAAGSIYGIMGPNGSGKSTLLGAMTRMVDLSRGSLYLDGTEYHRTPAAKVAHMGVARTFQTVRLLPGLTVLENVMLATDLNRQWRKRGGRIRKMAQVSDAIALTGLDGLEQTRPDELSYGVQRRVEIARAIAMRPTLLLLDEPTAGMNRNERREISLLLTTLRSQGLTQLLVEHDVQMMVDTCDYLFAMNSGTLIAEGTPVEVVREPSVRDAYLGKRWSEHASN